MRAESAPVKSSNNASPQADPDRTEPEGPEEPEASASPAGPTDSGADSVADSGAEPGEAEDGAADPPDSTEEAGEAGEAAEADAGPVLGPGAELDDGELRRELAALLFASPDPLSVARLVELLRRPPRERVRVVLDQLEEQLADSGLPIVLREVSGGWRLFTAPEQHETVSRLSRRRKVERVSPAGLETLAIVAYRQPVTKAEIEAIRGVQAGPVLRSLVDRGLVKVTGRADQPGAPLQYGTTREFLDRFGLACLKELPRDAELVRD